jgi:bile acid-coenzyme A ligase
VIAGSSAVAGLHDIVHHHAARTADREAVVLYRAGGSVERRSWAALSRDVEQRAEWLRRRGQDGPPDLVIVALSHGVSSLVSLLAASSLGSDVLPVDRGTEEQRATLLARTEADYPMRWLVDGESVTVAGRRRSPARTDPGYLISSGGTSGRAKLVRTPSPRRGPPPALFQHSGWRTGQRCFITGARSHAAFLSCLMVSVTDGSTAVLSDIFDPALISEILAAERVEWAQMMPTHMRQLQPYLDRARDWAALRAVLHTAGPCPTDTKRAWIAALGAERIYEMYAATEGIGVTLCRGDEWLEHIGTVGRGFFCRIKIVDEWGNRVPCGTVGTVYLRTVPSRHDPTAESTFRTVGDLGWLDRDGYLYLAGRADDMVVIEGENVHLSEVTMVVLSHPGVADAAVAAVEVRSGARLHGLVVARPGIRVSARELTDHCLASLPVQAVPRRWRLVDSLRRTASGKIQPAVLKRLVEEEA